MGTYVNEGSQQSTWEKRVNSGKMSGTPSQNPWKTMGSGINLSTSESWITT
jgi:hypothetical protein